MVLASYLENGSFGYHSLESYSSSELVLTPHFFIVCFAGLICVLTLCFSYVGFSQVIRRFKKKTASVNAADPESPREKPLEEYDFGDIACVFDIFERAAPWGLFDNFQPKDTAVDYKFSKMTRKENSEELDKADDFLYVIKARAHSLSPAHKKAALAVVRDYVKIMEAIPSLGEIREYAEAKDHGEWVDGELAEVGQAVYWDGGYDKEFLEAFMEKITEINKVSSALVDEVKREDVRNLKGLTLESSSLNLIDFGVIPVDTKLISAAGQGDGFGEIVKDASSVNVITAGRARRALGNISDAQAFARKLPPDFTINGETPQQVVERVTANNIMAYAEAKGSSSALGADDALRVLDIHGESLRQVSPRVNKGVKEDLYVDAENGDVFDYGHSDCDVDFLNDDEAE